MQKIGGPVGVEGGGGYSVAQSADCRKRTTNLEGKVADDGLLRGILASPVSGPFYSDLLAYNIRS